MIHPSLPLLLCVLASEYAGRVARFVVRRSCKACGKKVLVSPSSAVQLKRGETQAVCPACHAAETTRRQAEGYPEALASSLTELADPLYFNQRRA